MSFGLFAQTIPEPPKKVGVYLQIINGESDAITVLSDSLNVRFNTYLIPPDNSEVESFHIKLKVNESQNLLDFILTVDGSGLPEGVDAFNEEGVWYISTQSYTGIDSYIVECSAIYPDGVESSPTVFSSKD